MRNHLIIYAALVILFIIFNLFVSIDDRRISTALNILFSSILFGYIAYMAFVLLKKIGKKK